MAFKKTHWCATHFQPQGASTANVPSFCQSVDLPAPVHILYQYDSASQWTSNSAEQPNQGILPNSNGYYYTVVYFHLINGRLLVDMRRNQVVTCDPDHPSDKNWLTWRFWLPASVNPDRKMPTTYQLLFDYGVDGMERYSIMSEDGIFQPGCETKDNVTPCDGPLVPV